MFFNMNWLIKTVSLAFCSFLSISADSRPNIIIMMADDMGYSDIGCYGGEVATPELNNLATNGLRYSQMYNTSKCTTTRSSLLTGRYVDSKSYSANYEAGPTFGEVAKDAGYRTLWSGKNHSHIRPPERGFDRFYGFQGGACNFWNPGNKTQDGKDFPHIIDYEWMVNDKWIKPFIPENESYYMTDEITTNALNWLDEYKAEEKPFLLYLAYNAPHWPLHAKKEDIKKYEGVYDGGYQAIREARYKKMIQEGIIDADTAPLHPQPITDWNEVDPEEQKRESKRMEIHAAMIDNLDQNIGRVVNWLKDSGELENTLILFFVDNGASEERTKRYEPNYVVTGKEEPGSVMTYDCIGKQWSLVANTPLHLHKKTSFEGGINSPMIAHWPKGISKGHSWSHQPVHLVDIMSTVIDLSKGSYPKSFNGKKAKPKEGISLRPSFSGDNLEERSTKMGFQWAKGYALRDHDWKIVRLGQSKPWELYNMKVDRTETNNLASKMPEKVKAMNAQWEKWNKQVKADLK